MQLLTTMVGLSIGASAMPMVMQMAITPAITQVKTNNFGIAEQKAVVYASANEGGSTMGEVPEGCEVEEIESKAFSITCVEGEKQFKATVTRSFRSDGDLPGSFSYPYDPPTSYTHYQCPHYDPWGVVSFNRAHLGGRNCVPIPLQSPANFAEWAQEDWLWTLVNTVCNYETNFISTERCSFVCGSCFLYSLTVA